MNPIAALRALIVGLALAVLTTAGGFWWGWSKRGDQEQVARAELILEAHATEVKLNDDIAKLDAAKQQETKRYEQSNDLYHAAVRAGAVRMSIPARASAPADPAASGVVPEARCELDPEAAVRIDRIANEGDEAIRQLNALIDLYNEVRDRLNGSP